MGIANKIIDYVSKMRNIHRIIAGITILQIILYIIAYVCKVTWITEVDTLLDIMNPIIFAFILTSYSYYFENTFKGIMWMAAAMVVNIITYIIFGYDINTAVALCGIELPITILGIVIMLVINMIKDKGKTRENKTKLSVMFGKPLRIKLIYKLMAYSILFTVLITMYNSASLQGINNTDLRMLMIMQAILPSFIMICYITFTDIAFPVMILYNIIYVIVSMLVLAYVNFSVITIINMAELTLIIGYLVSYYKYNYKISIKNIKERDNADG